MGLGQDGSELELDQAIDAAVKFINNTQDPVKISPRSNEIQVLNNKMKTSDIDIFLSAINPDTGQLDANVELTDRQGKILNALTDEQRKEFHKILSAAVSLSMENEIDRQEALDFILQSANAKVGLDATIALMGDDELGNNNHVVVTNPPSEGSILTISSENPSKSMTLDMDDLRTLGKLWLDYGADGSIKFNPDSPLQLFGDKDDQKGNVARFNEIVEILNSNDIDSTTRFQVYRMATAAKWYESYISGTDDFENKPGHVTEVQALLAKYDNADFLDINIRNQVPKHSIPKDIVAEADELVNPENYITPYSQGERLTSGRPR